ncbi:MAG: 30S ribosomal protein S4 [Candidatus Jettenia sp.]|uniref:Small ribosomal subunit protein uS4 n=1 Tax=Candidatus Jettenia caeni TaxID=247490 RepID=I3IM86_9BACT|nr:30S ribosomal protein S4 [Candidatus Jettenia sp. AMX1]MBC6927711.1 30S ribosomal protein S4 [Candidatus Jettenia sp.]NUN22087.1 30S ribosomal protein S4 [Candidatus Jettenia caeni]KAA0251400.1 MAG: 30S ribosomal protein S4 [Candidatus Jettenia sp. AMX1]MCE7879377.1 30S ribosomal protein S4 [Candidatus Jettenia sp. AMX1]MDL1938326.1 30S ribosomal protein S4 [Candidatus Jettenia sp. AMX1]
MARYVGPQCRLCRREGEKLFLKGIRCDTVKCAISKRKYPPGQFTWGRGKLSKYGIQFREKQKIKRFYGILERQFQNYYKKAEKQKGNTGENLLNIFERRLDNVLYLVSFAISRKQGRQIIQHGHISVNDKKVDIASYLVKAGDIIKPKNDESSLNIIKSNIEFVKGRNAPAWIEFRKDTLEAVVTQLPTRDDISVPIQEQLIVELCSK